MCERLHLAGWADSTVPSVPHHPIPAAAMVAGIAAALAVVCASSAVLHGLWVHPAVSASTTHAVSVLPVPPHRVDASHTHNLRSRPLSVPPGWPMAGSVGQPEVSMQFASLAWTAKEEPDAPPVAEPIPLWAHLVTPLTLLLLCGMAVVRMALYGQWPAPPWAGATPAPMAPLDLQLRASTGMQSQDGGRGGEPSWWEACIIVTQTTFQDASQWLSDAMEAIADWISNKPIDAAMLAIFVCSVMLWKIPSLESVFLVQGFRNPLAFIMSGFACFNIYQLFSDIFYVYILGKAYCAEFPPDELALLYGGGTMMGSLLVALTPGSWMGPTAGTAALLTAFMLRHPTTPMAIPMIPLIFFPMQVRWIGTSLAAVNFYLFSKGVASGAAFTGGVLIALLLNPRKELKVRDTSQFQ
eukprot:GGOE01041041.1.p1 GENE.GGOE01041041.1~~GGOE01041041.1.p1  ORF type:complete len:426 (+),score=93.11 GGOE01041041.1:47-1279(+)